MMMRTISWYLGHVTGCLAILFFAVAGQAQTGPEAVAPDRQPFATTPVMEPGPAPAGPFGYAVKRPVLGAACPSCPWGALAAKVKLALDADGYDVQICNNCSGLDSVRIVDERRRPGKPRQEQIALGVRAPPDAPVDFGVVAGEFLYQAYHGVARYSGDGARPNLRMIAKIEDPSYYLVAVRRGGLISDLADISAKHLPATIVVDDKPMSREILAYYGITEDRLKSWGGRIVENHAPERGDYNVVIGFANSLNNTPESGIWYALSQTTNMQFLQLPDALLHKLADGMWTMGEAPVGLIRGMTGPIRTVVTSGTIVYGRADMPERFTYDVARALDKGKGLLKWSLIPFSYEPEQVWRYMDLPLHPGAARYYRERGYLSAANAKAANAKAADSRPASGKVRRCPPPGSSALRQTNHNVYAMV